MFIQSIGNSKHYPVVIEQGKKVDFDLFSFRTYQTIGGKFKQVSKYLMDGRKKVKAIHNKAIRINRNSIEVLPNQLKMEFIK